MRLTELELIRVHVAFMDEDLEPNVRIHWIERAHVLA